MKALSEVAPGGNLEESWPLAHAPRFEEINPRFEEMNRM